MSDALRKHWPEYLMEGAELALFMFSASAFSVLLEYAYSPIHQAISEPFLRRALMGIAMGVTAIAIVYSPWGKQSGAHFNPSVTLTFFRLGKVRAPDAAFYVAAQFIGGIGGVAVAALLFRNELAHPSVNYVVTIPGGGGPFVAFVAELVITFILMAVILTISNTPRLASYTGVFAGALVALYITFEAPLSGMSMNPARTFSSAVGSHTWTSLWVYFTAPLLGMIAASEAYVRVRGRSALACAKLHHKNSRRCIHCGANMNASLNS